MSLSVEPATIREGGSATLRWKVLNGDRFTLRDELGVVLIENGPPEGSLPVTPESGRGTKIYSLSASRSEPSGNLMSTASLEVLPRVILFTLSPQPIRRGESSTLRWEIVNADRATILEDGSPIVDGSALAGVIRVDPEVTTDYRLVSEWRGRSFVESGIRLIVEP